MPKNRLDIYLLYSELYIKTAFHSLEIQPGKSSTFSRNYSARDLPQNLRNVAEYLGLVSLLRGAS